MASFPVLHEAFDTIRFGRVQFAEVAPADPSSTLCRYCRVLERGAVVPPRGHFSNPESCAKAILDLLGSGEAPELVALGGFGDPLRELGIGSVMRRIRTTAHLGTILFTDGAILQDRDARRDASEAETVVTWVPALLRAGDPIRGSATITRQDAFDRHVEGIAALRRESQVRVVVEIEVRPGENDLPASLAAWRRAIETIRPHRVFVIPQSTSPAPETIEALERARVPLGRIAGISLLDPTAADRRCWCEGPAGS